MRLDVPILDGPKVSSAKQLLGELPVLCGTDLDAGTFAMPAVKDVSVRLSFARVVYV